MIETRPKTRLDRLQWMHAKLTRAKSDISMVKAHFKDVDKRGDAVSLQNINDRLDQIRWDLETEIRFEKRLDD